MSKPSPLLLLVETSTAVCSVAVYQQGQTLLIKESNESNSHAEQVAGFIEKLLKELGADVSMLDAIAVSKGPGSYTGLRIGVSSVKGLAFALGIPVFAINSLESLAYHFMDTHQPAEGFICPMIDARRMEVYTAVFNETVAGIEPTQALVVDEQSFKTYLDAGPVHFIGDGAAKCTGLIKHPNAKFYPNFLASAKGMITPAMKRYREGSHEDLAYFEPYYLKDFVAAIPKVKGLKQA